MPAKAIEGRLMLTTFPNFFDRWYNASTEVPLAHLPTAENIYKRQVFYMLPVISGFSTNRGKANVTYNITVKRGEEVLFEKNAVTGFKKVVKDSSGVFLCETVLNYEFATTDPDGKYTIAIDVIDNIAHDTAKLEKEITVRAYTFNESRFTMIDSFLIWQNYYYEGLEKDREIDGLMFFSFPQMQTNAEKTISLLAFFAELFKSKPYLQHELENIFTSRNENERLTIIHVLHLAGYMPNSLQSKFSEAEKKYYADLKGYGLPTVPKEGIQNHILLNMQWAKFFATGGYEYAKLLANAFELAKHNGALEAYSESKQTEADKQAAFLETVYQKHIEHMLKRLPNHPLLNGYFLHMMRTSEVSELVKKELEAVVIK